MNIDNPRNNLVRKHFIEVTSEIIEKEGFDNVTARKIAKAAGYTSSSTVYNYFSELSHLLFFAAMRFTKDYMDEVHVYLERGKNYLEKYLLSWECFCKHSFLKPDIYYAIFVADLGVTADDLMNQYYTMFETELTNVPEELRELLRTQSFIDRNKHFLQIAVEEGVLTDDHLDEKNRIVILTWKGMLVTLLNNRTTFTQEEATEKMVQYIKTIFQQSP